MVGIIIVANMIFIPIYGIIGSAIATAITVSANNFLRFLFLKIKYQMQPYDLNSLKIILIAGLAIFPSFFIPAFDKYIDIVLRSTLVGGIFILLLLKLEAAPELNHKIRKNLKRFGINL